MEPSKIITVYKVAPETIDFNPIVFADLKCALNEVKYLIDYGEVGDSVVIMSDTMTQVEYDALPEHGGW